MIKQFYTVVSSLPRLSAHYKMMGTPISRLQLEKRLSMLPEQVVELLYQIESLVWTSWYSSKQTVSQTQVLYHQLIQNDCFFVRQTVDWFMELRTIFTALRMRSEKNSAPKEPNHYWISARSQIIITHWDEPDFGLKAIYPWLPQVVSYMANKDTESIEKFLLTYSWSHLSSIENRHDFDIEYLIIYLLRWNIIHYWSKFNNEEALKRVIDLSNTLIQTKNIPKELYY